jgi:hypothetical protein
VHATCTAVVVVRMDSPLDPHHFDACIWWSITTFPRFLWQVLVVDDDDGRVG